MRKTVFSSVFGAMCLVGSMAAAQGANILASNPQTIMDFFAAEGYPAKLTEDSVGDPLIEFRVSGDRFDLFFYDCTDNIDCQAVQFYSGYNVDGSLDIETINSWNEDRRFVRAYMVNDGATVRIEMDIATSEHGLHPDDFGDLMVLWEESVDLFEDRIDW